MADPAAAIDALAEAAPGLHRASNHQRLLGTLALEMAGADLPDALPEPWVEQVELEFASLGHDVDTFWSGLIAGRCGVARVSLFDPKDFASQIGAEVRNWEAAQHMDPKEARRNDRYTHFGFCAARQAIPSNCWRSSPGGGPAGGVKEGGCAFMGAVIAKLPCQIANSSGRATGSENALAQARRCC